VEGREGRRHGGSGEGREGVERELVKFLGNDTCYTEDLAAAPEAML